MTSCWSLFSFAATVRDNLLTPEIQSQWSTLHILQYLPQWGWQGWLTGLLLITLMFALEGSYQFYERERRRVEDLTGGVDAWLDNPPDTPLLFTAAPHHWLIIPRATIWNRSEKRAASIDVELRVTIKGTDKSMPLAPGSFPVAEYEQQVRHAVNQILTFPLNLAPRYMASGYITFSADRLKQFSVDPDFTNCVITFRNSGKIIWSQTIWSIPSESV